MRLTAFDHRDLADMSNDGKLTRDGFAVALHLITGKLAGKEVPSTLPTSLIPPGMRKGVAAAPVPTPQSWSSIFNRSLAA